ncbi:MAG: DUF3137 domain-containing protein [Tenericutes bacterium]|nr:DUF3137 domain-containing protein [Mycoplasmatota bacterium]
MEENNLDVFNQNKKAAEKDIIIGGIGLAIGIITIAISYTSSVIPTLVIGVIIAIAGLVFLIKGSSSFSKLNKRFKNDVLSKMFKELIPDIEYRPDFGLNEGIVYGTDFLKRADRFHSEDFLEGKIEDVNFISSDVKLEERHVQHTKNGTRVYYVTYFLGRVFRFAFNKEFIGSLQVLESSRPKSKGYDRVKLESIDFNKKFKTYATEDITAFYILTPDIMEAIFNLEKRHPGRIGLSFHGEHLYVAINNNKDTFEIKMFRQIDDSMIKEFEKDLLVIKDFIMTLKLNNNLFKKK